MNKNVLDVVGTLDQIRGITDLDALEQATLEIVIDKIPMIPAGMFKNVAVPHKTRKGQRVLRQDNLVISCTVRPDADDKDPETVMVKHVKRLARVK